MSTRLVYKYELNKETLPECLERGGTRAEWEAEANGMERWETLTRLIGERVRELGFRVKVNAIGEHAKVKGVYSQIVPDLDEDIRIGKRFITLNYSTVLDSAELVDDDKGGFMLTIPYLTDHDTLTYFKVSKA